jgi:hypothetical protein
MRENQLIIIAEWHTSQGNRMFFIVYLNDIQNKSLQIRVADIGDNSMINGF